MDVSGATIIVTGASAGIGDACARDLAARGARVVAAARRADRLAQLAEQCPGVIPVVADVTVAADRARIIDAARATGRLDALVNNAGQGLHVPVAELEDQDVRAVYELNVVAPLMLMNAVIDHLPVGGAIVNVSSLTSLRVFPSLGGYASTKAALNMLSSTARLEFASRGVSVSLVYPFITATEFHSSLRKGSLAARPGMEPHPASWVANAIRFALESGAGHVMVGEQPVVLVPGEGAGTAIPQPLG